ncbi:MAG: cob(I)yrinic acid a,c-diamide adenosyltransferase [Lentimicrobiaceae bacterium]|nr:cob(I)yrinic acid a,c-diamide adenosyltransferase [Lentimicrobiaceae bacterium]
MKIAFFLCYTLTVFILLNETASIHQTGGISTTINASPQTLKEENFMSKIYTKSGDTGFTSLVGGAKVHKSDTILDVYGTCDELNAQIGVLIAEANVPFLTEIQEKLFVIGGILATPLDKYEQYWKDVSLNSFLTKIEKEIDTMDETLSPLHSFLLPQGSRAIAQTHICRTVCRKLERKIAPFATQNTSFLELLQMVNRLADYFFILTRFLHIKFCIEEKYLEMR